MQKLCSALIHLLLCAGTVVTACGATRDSDLDLIFGPRLEDLDPAVRAQLTNRQAVLAGLIKSGEQSSSVLAAHFGDLGGLYLLYDFPDSARAALELAHQGAPEEFRWSYLLGFFYQSDGRLEDAVRLYDQALQQRPANLAALVRSGMVSLDQGDLTAASQRFERALEVSLSCAAAHYGLGKLAAVGGEWQAAADRFEEALKLQPVATAVHYPLSQAYRQLGDAERAMKHISLMGSAEVTVPDPELLRLRALATGAFVHFVRGKRALAQGDLQVAAEEFETAVNADPGNAPMRRGYGLTLRKMGRIADAIDQYQEALKVEPANPLNYQDLGLANMESGDLQSARQNFQRAIDLDPSFSEAYFGLGIAHARSGEFAAALEHFDRSLKISPFNTDVIFQRSLALLQLGQVDQAKASFEDLLARDPDHAVAYVNLARIHEQEGNLDAAEELAKQGLERAPPDSLSSRAYLLLGRIKERQGDFDAALPHYLRAAALDRDLAPAMIRLGSLQARRGDFDSAARSYGVALERLPNYRLAWRALISTLIYSEHYEEAKGVLESRLKASPGDPVLLRSLALLLSTCPAEGIRSGERSLELARQAFASLSDPTSAQILLMTLAENKQFAAAVRGQEHLLEGFMSAGPEARVGPSQQLLALYVSGTPAREPWLADPALLGSPVIPLTSVTP